MPTPFIFKQCMAITLSGILLVGAPMQASAFFGHNAEYYGDTTTGTGTINTYQDKIDGGKYDGQNLSGFYKLEMAGSYIKGKSNITIKDSQLSIKNPSIHATFSVVPTASSIFLRGGLADGNSNHTLTNNTIIISSSDEKHNYIRTPNAFSAIGGEARGNGKHILSGNKVSLSDGIQINAGYKFLEFMGARADGKGDHELSNNTAEISGDVTSSGLERGNIFIKGAHAINHQSGNMTFTDNKAIIKNSSIQMPLLDGTDFTPAIHIAGASLGEDKEGSTLFEQLGEL